jgi:hypothetical protein
MSSPKPSCFHCLRKVLEQLYVWGCIQSFQTGRLERKLKMVQFSDTRCSCVAILFVSLVNFSAISLCVASQHEFVVYFVIDSIRKLLDIPSYVHIYVHKTAPCLPSIRITSTYFKMEQWNKYNEDTYSERDIGEQVLFIWSYWLEKLVK